MNNKTFMDNMDQDEIYEESSYIVTYRRKKLSGLKHRDTTTPEKEYKTIIYARNIKEAEQKARMLLATKRRKYMIVSVRIHSIRERSNKFNTSIYKS